MLSARLIKNNHCQSCAIRVYRSVRDAGNKNKVKEYETLTFILLIKAKFRNREERCVVKTAVNFMFLSVSNMTTWRSTSLLHHHSKWWWWWVSTSSQLFSACCSHNWCYCSNSSMFPALLIILSAYCTYSSLLWISGCHVCVLTGFHPYGTMPTWTKFNATGCQEEQRVRQQGEHVKRPDGFLFGDGDRLRQLVLVGRSEQMWNEII